MRVIQLSDESAAAESFETLMRQLSSRASGNAFSKIRQNTVPLMLRFAGLNLSVSQAPACRFVHSHPGEMLGSARHVVSRF